MVERSIYRRWERAGTFTPRPRPRRGKKPFVLVIPPPNITGSLHMGHALQDTIMDVLTRYRRMRGDDTLWVPGTDHAGIATQNVVEKQLQKEGLSRHDLGREKFLERVWQWKKQYGQIITEQIRRLGGSCDWTRERFTLDAGYVRAVQEAFIHYARKGLLYRGERMVNWCPRCTSSISDLEVRYEEREGTMSFVRYPLVASGGQREAEGGRDVVTVATTRPETMFGDVAVAAHPDDPRYRSLVGKRVQVPLADREIPVIADRTVDREFGTGAVKVTPAHDAADAEVAERHHLQALNVIGEDGRMTVHVPEPYRGLLVQEARERVRAELRSLGLVEKEERVRHRVGLCQRCGTTIQPLVSMQWFVRMAPLAKPAIVAIEGNFVRFTPARWKKSSLEWLRSVRDWCVSRQLWWGHRLPVWYCQTGKRNPKPETRNPNMDADAHVVFSIAKPKACPDCGGKDFMQDPDVLDTWFSSALWPFAVFGWPEATGDLRRFYPTSVLTTAPEILHLWVARMIFSGLEFLNPKSYVPARTYGKRRRAQQVPFQNVIIHQTVLNLKGQRMSKSLGTGVDPMGLVEEYGADAVRFGLLFQSQRDQQALRFDTQAVRTGRNFANKVWNIGRYVQGIGKREQGLGNKSRRAPPYLLHPTPFDRWILARLAAVTREVTEALETFRLGDALRTLHAFLWNDYADWYIEASKVPGTTTPAIARDVFLTSLRLLHPFLPFVTEVLQAQLLHKKPMLIVSPWPETPRRRRPARALVPVRSLQAAVRALRAARTLLGLPLRTTIVVRIRGSAALQSLFPVIAFLAGCRQRASGEASEPWIPLPAGPGVRVEIQRGALAGVDVGARLARAEKRAQESRSVLEHLDRQLASMRGHAAAATVEATAKRLAAVRDELAEHEVSVATLRALLG